MSAPGWIVLAFLGAVMSRTQVTASSGSAHVLIPVLALVALAVALVAAALVLALLRSIVRDAGLRPRVVTR